MILTSLISYGTACAQIVVKIAVLAVTRSSNCKSNIIIIGRQLDIMTIEPEDAESELIKQMFEEIMKMIREKHIRLESIVQRMVENEVITKESFERVYKLLAEY